MSVFRPGLFVGQTALVTGGATGIGNAIARELMALGCNVVIAARNVERLNTAVDQLSTDYGTAADVMAVKCNIRLENEGSRKMGYFFATGQKYYANVKKTIAQAAVAATLKRFGRLDFLVNNGGGQFPSAAADIKTKGWNAVIDTNLNAYNQWMKENGGVIVNIIADMWRGFPMMSHTGAARAGVHNLTQSLAVEWAQSGVRVNAIAPGIIYSDTAAANYATGAEFFNSQIPGIPAKRLGTVEEVSSCVCYLLSPAAAYVTGTTIKVDGAQSIYKRQVIDIKEHEKNPAFHWQDAITSKSKL